VSGGDPVVKAREDEMASGSRLRVALTGLVAMTAWQAFAADTPVKIGVLTDMSGFVADISGAGSVLAARMAVEDFGGSVLGRPIEIVSGDHQNKPDVGAAVVRRWLDSEGVDAIADVPTSSVGLAVQEITRTKSRLFINSAGSSGDFTGKACSPLANQWNIDTYTVANGVPRVLIQRGLDTWSFVTADYTFGLALERDATAAIAKAGGKVLGSVKHPLNNHDFSSFLLQAQAMGAKVIGFANGSGDTIRSIQQAREFGLVDDKRRIAAFILHVTDVHALGLEVAQGTLVMDTFYWDRNSETKAWSQRFMARNNGRPPSAVQAGAYSAVLHYLKAIAAAGTKEAAPVSAKMKDLKIDDALIKEGFIREDGRVVKDYYLLEVKKPSELKYPWDYFKVTAIVPGNEVTRPLSEGNCPLVAGK
jgi:branched-chain amino acid transport system substrate-binding protein